MRDGYSINKNILQGKQAKSDGEFFERMIDGACEKYKAKGTAFIDKTPEPLKPIRPLGRGQFVAHYTTQAQPDYKGTLLGGQSIVFEAKMTNHDRITQDRVKPWQIEALQEHDKLGAETFILVYFMNENKCFRIPTNVWANMKQFFGRKYVLSDELKQFEVETSGMDIKFLEESFDRIQNESKT